MNVADLSPGLFKLRFKALGTDCVVQFRTGEVEVAKEFRSEVLRWIREFEERWSRFKAGSLLCRINELAGRESVALSEEEDEVVALCDYTFRTSGGLIDPTSLPLTHLWDAAAREDRMPGDGEIAATVARVSWGAVEYEEGRIFLPEAGMAMEIGGFGKEYAVDRLIRLARECGVEHALVDLGRDVATLGSPPHGPYWVVGVENARELDSAVHRVAIRDVGLATSGNGRRFRTVGGKVFGHIIDARTGWPVENELLTASCLAGDCLTAGILSTVSCVTGVEEGLAEVDRTLNAAALFQTADQLYFSENIHRYLIPS
ncbi:MAG: FAD:protein FMN transferase [Verrucomicrobiaceae bacterium]